MKNKINNELAVCGFEAVKALAASHPEKITRLYFTEDRSAQLGFICSELAKRKAPYNKVESSQELEKLCGSVHHQGVVAMIVQPEIHPLTTEIVETFIHKNESVVLLDHIGNANNLGAIVRSAAFFGIKNIIIPLDESQSSVTTSSYRVAQGGMEYVTLYSIKSIEKLLIALTGRMVRLGTDVSASLPISKIGELSKQKPAIIVLGNEEHGISEDVKKLCDYLITIPFGTMNDSDDSKKIESLNVAQAAAIILYELRKK
jgi:RNA methyltransferase, TrmH family